MQHQTAQRGRVAFGADAIALKATKPVMTYDRLMS